MEVSNPTAPRMLTEDPTRALCVARSIFEDEEDGPFVATVLVYQLTRGKLYSVEGGKTPNDSRDGTVVFLSHKGINREVIESFFGEWKQFATPPTEVQQPLNLQV